MIFPATLALLGTLFCALCLTARRLDAIVFGEVPMSRADIAGYSIIAFVVFFALLGGL